MIAQFLLASGVFFPSIAAAAVIDNFATGDQMITRPAGQGNAAITDTAPISGSLFQSRFLSFSFGGSQSLTVTTDLQQLEYSLAPGDNGYFQFGYDSTTPVDLWGGGASAIRFHFASASGGTRFPANLRIQTDAGPATYSWGFALTDIFNAHHDAFFVDVPLSKITGGDLSRVTQLTFDAYRIQGSSGFHLTGIETIPEPSSLFLLPAGVAPFVFGRSRQ